MGQSLASGARSQGESSYPQSSLAWKWPGAKFETCGCWASAGLSHSLNFMEHCRLGSPLPEALLHLLRHTPDARRSELPTAHLPPFSCFSMHLERHCEE